MLTSVADPSRMQFFLPQFFQLPSGLWLPTSVQEVVEAGPRGQPMQLGDIELIAVRRGPDVMDQVAVYADESALGLPLWTHHEMVAELSALPLEATVRFYATLANLVSHIENDGAAQAELVIGALADPGSEFAERVRDWVSPSSSSTNRVLFSMQQVSALQRLAILQCNESDRAQELPVEIQQKLFALLVSAGTSMLDRLRHDDADSQDEQFVYWMIGAPRLSGGRLASNIARSIFTYAHAGRPLDLNPAADAQRCDSDQWLTDQYGLDYLDLQALAMAVLMGSGAIDQSNRAEPIVDEGFLSTTPLADRTSRAMEALSGDAQWFRAAFAGRGDSKKRRSRDIVPFLQRPMLRLTSGAHLLLSPTYMSSWLDQTGAYHRIAELAARRGERPRFMTYNGYLIQAYLMRLARCACSTPTASTATREAFIDGDLDYFIGRDRRDSPDIMILLEGHLVLFEITTKRLTETAMVDGDPEAIRSDLAKMAADKWRLQLRPFIESLLGHTAAIDGLDVNSIHTITPIIVVHDFPIQSSRLWADLLGEVHADDLARVTPPLVLSVPEFEYLFELVSAGHWLPTILERKSAPQWRHRDFTHWHWHDGKQFAPDERISNRLFQLAMTDIAGRLGFDGLSAPVT